MPNRKEVGHEEARDIVAKVGDRLGAQGQGAAVAVVDAHGVLAFAEGAFGPARG